MIRAYVSIAITVTFAVLLYIAKRQEDQDKN